jgi:hypothetical protein
MVLHISGCAVVALDSFHELGLKFLDVLRRPFQALMFFQNRSEFVSEALFANALAVFDSPVGVAHAPEGSDAHSCA